MEALGRDHGERVFDRHASPWGLAAIRVLMQVCSGREGKTPDGGLSLTGCRKGPPAARGRAKNNPPHLHAGGSRSVAQAVGLSRCGSPGR